MSHHVFKPMTVRQLRRHLDALAGEYGPRFEGFFVAMACDPEGNNFSFMSSRECDSIGIEEISRSDGTHIDEFIDDDERTKPDCLVLWPA